MPSKKSTPTTKPQAAKKATKRGNQSRDDQKSSATNQDDADKADTDDDSDNAADDGRNAESATVSPPSTPGGESEDENEDKDEDEDEDKPTSGSSSLIMQLVSSFVGNNLQDAVASVKSKVTEQMEMHGAEYLDSAKSHLIEVTEKVTAWGKKHPVQAVAAATALIGVSAFLYATLRDKDDEDSSKPGAKNQA